MTTCTKHHRTRHRGLTIRNGVAVRRLGLAVLPVFIGGFAQEPTDPGKPSPPNGAGQTSPQEDDLAKRLIRRTAGGDDQDIMANILRLMDESGRRLEIDFDAGEKTQSIQEAILDQLNEAIETAAARRRMYRMAPQPPVADKRRKAQRNADTSNTDQGRPDDTGRPAPSLAPEETDAAQIRRPSDGELLELRKAWGHLPMRQRDEIIQGISESFLERYREWIERYYRALQESGE